MDHKRLRGKEPSCACLVDGRQLRRGEEGLQAVERRADLAPAHVEAEVQRAHVAAGVDERVRVLLHQQVAQRAALGHQPEQVEVAAEELRAQAPASGAADQSASSTSGLCVTKAVSPKLQASAKRNAHEQALKQAQICMLMPANAHELCT